eukprot:maker-scaffold_12-snap-gene-4.48-mRNA-1 protein AED:0.00 eAED:0.00 QI:519/0/0.5/1/0/0/2/369/64
MLLIWLTFYQKTHIICLESLFFLNLQNNILIEISTFVTRYYLLTQNKFCTGTKTLKIPLNVFRT